MNQDATSLDRLHDLVLPAPVPWWPLAPGWYVVLTLLALAAVWAAWRCWRRWQANAYRRVALRELAASQDAPAIAELLRRTALAIVPRSAVAGMTGPAWVGWLAAQCPTPMSPDVRQVLTIGVYGRPTVAPEVAALRDYARFWIAHHKLVRAGAGRPD